MTGKVYYDWFAHEVVFEKDEYAAPERYTELIRNDNYFYAEKWAVKDENGIEGLLHIAYSKEDMKYLQDIRANKERAYKTKLMRMIQLQLPPDEYDETVRGMRKEE